MVLMFYYSVFLGNLGFVIATVMANSINPCCQVLWITVTQRTKTTHRSPFLPYDGPEVTLVAFVALLLALHLDPLSSTVYTLQKDFSVLCIQPQWVLYIPPPAQSTLPSTFHSPLWCDPLRGE